MIFFTRDNQPFLSHFLSPVKGFLKKMKFLPSFSPMIFVYLADCRDLFFISRTPDLQIIITPLILRKIF
jgi:hypothetical protein